MLVRIGNGPRKPLEHTARGPLTPWPPANIFIFMPTTVHLPKELLKRVDARAKALGISRNRLITEALESSLRVRDQWPPELVNMLEAPFEGAAAKQLDRSVAAVRKRRVSRRGAPEL